MRRVIQAAILVLAMVGPHDRVAAQSSSASISRETRHLKFTATLSPRTLAPGQRLTLAVDIAPKPGMHVYAPGSKYRPITITVEPQAGMTIGNPLYPTPSSYYFKPLNETVDVYRSPFRLAVEIAAGDTTPVPSSIVLKGALEYQACDDRVCYLPESIPLRWTVTLATRTLRSAPHRR